MRHHLEVVTTHAGRSQVAARLTALCWPGGAADRSQPAALAWVSRWRPQRAGVDLVACSCSTGRCAVCN